MEHFKEIYPDNIREVKDSIYYITKEKVRAKIFDKGIRPDGRKLTARGECKGRVLTEPVGDGGFGYDPLFVPDGYTKTFAELSPEEKNAISHRGRALAEAVRILNGGEPDVG